MDQRNVPKLDFGQIKQTISLPDVLQAFGILDRFEQTRNRLSGQCPLHEHTSPIPNRQQFKADCCVDGKTWQWFCFGDCNQGGDVLKFVLKFGGLEDYRQVRLWFWQHFASQLRNESDSDRGIKTGTEKAGEEKQIAAAEPSPTVELNTSLPARPPGVEPLRWSYNLTPSEYLLTKRRFQHATLEYFGGIGLASNGWCQGRIAVPLYPSD